MVEPPFRADRIASQKVRRFLLTGRTRNITYGVVALGLAILQIVPLAIALSLDSLISSPDAVFPLVIISIAALIVSLVLLLGFVLSTSFWAYRKVRHNLKVFKPPYRNSPVILKLNNEELMTGNYSNIMAIVGIFANVCYLLATITIAIIIFIFRQDLIDAINGLRVSFNTPGFEQFIIALLPINYVYLSKLTAGEIIAYVTILLTASYGIVITRNSIYLLRRFIAAISPPTKEFEKLEVKEGIERSKSELGLFGALLNLVAKQMLKGKLRPPFIQYLISLLVFVILSAIATLFIPFIAGGF